MFKKNKGKIAIALVVVLIAGFIGMRFLNQTEEVIAQEEKSYSVEVLTASVSNEDRYLEYSAIIKNRDMEEVIFPIVANIKEIYVSEGETVKEGQLLVTLEDDTAKRQEESAYQAMVSAESTMNSAKSNLDLAQLQYDKELEDQKNDSQYKTLKENYDTSKENLEKVQSELDEINAQVKPLSDELATLNSELETLTKEKTNKELEISKKQAELDKLNEDLALTPDDAELQAKADEIQGDLDNLNLELEVVDNNISDKNTEVLEKETEIANLETSLNKQEKETELTLATTENETNRIAFQAKESEMEIQLAASKNARDTASYTYDGAKASYESAKTNHETAKDAVEDLNYYAKTSGIILTITQSVGEVATPLIPIMVVGTDDLVAEFGVSQEDVAKVKKGNYSLVSRGDESYSAEVVSVSVVPDETSRTYLTQVLLNNKEDDFLIGELVSLKVYTGNEIGVFLPINVILNDGEDYVYIVENNRAVRKNIEIVGISDNYVMVEGLDLEDLVISKGMKNIKSGYLVSIV